MAAGHFEIVTIKGDRPGQHLNISNTLQVAEMLVNSWPDMSGPAYKEAVKASVDHMAGRVSAEIVRAAFISAAKEAGIFIREGPLLQ